MNVQKNIVKINGSAHVLTRWRYDYKPGGGRSRRRSILKFIIGWSRGVLYKICLGVASAAEVAANVTRANLAAFRWAEDEAFRRRVLMDAAIGAG